MRLHCRILPKIFALIHVSFNYSAERMGVKNLSLNICRGEYVMFVGRVAQEKVPSLIYQPAFTTQIEGAFF